MNRVYPIMLNLAGKSAVVIGGGKIAERKVNGLLETGASITVVSPEVTSGLEQLARSGKIDWIQEPFYPQQLQQAFLIVAATDSREVNEAVFDSTSPHQLINIVDDPERSSFTVPSVIRRGRLTVAVSTGGASPILAKKIKSQLEQQLDQYDEDYLEFLYEARKLVLEQVSNPDEKRQLLEQLASPTYLDLEQRKKIVEQLINMKK